jgi:hypothetical protein
MLRQSARRERLALAPLSLAAAVLLGACGDDASNAGPDAGTALAGGQPGAATAGPGATTGAPGSGTLPPGGSLVDAATAQPTTPGTTAGTAPSTFGGSSAGTGGGAAMPGGAASTGGTGGGGAVPTPTFLDGPVDGDPSKPVVTIPGVACGGSKGGLDGLVGGGFGGFPVPGTANWKVGGRDVILTYPCNKREGAHMTFILNLHGTMPDEGLKFYQHSYFAAHALADSHNLIVASPKSVVQQWGNGDNGVDKPHLYELIDTIYSLFGSKFKITGLWVGGHSWGSMFAKTFACDEKLKERVRGVIGMSGGATGVGGGGFGGFTGGASGGAGTAGCADRVSQIHTVGDKEAGATGGVPDQTAVATKHGCKAKTGPKDLGNMQMLTEWPECSPGWTHFNVTMGAHEHTTPINPEVVKHIVEQIKRTEKK